MKFISSSLVMALFLASGSELTTIQTQVAALSQSEQPKSTVAEKPKPRFAQLDSESDSDSSSGESDEDAQLAEEIGVQHFMAAQHRSKVVGDINAKVKELDALLAANDDKDENWQ